METFKFNKGWRMHKIMAIGYPSIALLGLIAYLSIGFRLSEAGPIIVLGLLIWLIYEIIKLRKALSYIVELSEESIKVSGVEAKWENINKIGIMSAAGDKASIILHQINGPSLYILGATDGIQYVKGFIEA